MTAYTIIKRDENGVETIRYQGEMLERVTNYVVVRAVFQMASKDRGYMLLRHGDIFTEWHYSDRWYNIFRISDPDTGVNKGWYCNLTRPAAIHDDSVAADDLRLDLFVAPTGTVILLDEDEFAEIALQDHERDSER